MVIDLYYLSPSPPCRAIMMTANALGVKLNLKYVDLFNGGNKDPEYDKLNPQNTVPTMVDDGFILGESRAILSYLVEQYGKDDSLYPKDPKKRALVNHMLYFDACTIFPRFRGYYMPILYKRAEPDPGTCKRFEDALAILDKYLDGKVWVTGDQLTIADLSLIATISSVDIFEFNLSKYPNITRWLANAKKSIPRYDELNHAGLLEYKKIKDAKIIFNYNP